MSDRTFYVYVLRDDKGRPFYVGKGLGARMMAHILRDDPSGGCAKAAKIRDMKARGVGMAIEIDGWFETSREALAREAQLIASLGTSRIGDGPLTNVLRGEPTTSISIRMPVGLMLAARACAAHEGRSLGELVIAVLTRHVEQSERKAA